MRKLSTYLGGTVLAFVLICGFLAYFVTSFNQETEQWLDGFGRPLYASPWFMRVMFGQDRLWTGWPWFLGDMVIFWGGIVIGYALINLGARKRDF
jgi:hypothetical protein